MYKLKTYTHTHTHCTGNIFQTTELKDTPCVYSITLKHPQTACSQCRLKLLFVALNCSYKIRGSCFKFEFKMIYFETHMSNLLLKNYKALSPLLKPFIIKISGKYRMAISLHHSTSIPKTQRNLL
jgi:hypothetical protein